MKLAFALYLLLLVLAATGGCMENASTVSDRDEVSEASAPAPDPTIDPQLANKFMGLAPADWRLRRVEEASAQYDFQLPSVAGEEPVVIHGAVLLDGRFEGTLGPWRFSPAVIARDREKFGPVAPDYPVANGFQAVFDSRSAGFDTKRNVQVRSIKYLNREQGVFCWGNSPGLLRCLWGNPDVRLVVHFHSDQTVPALEYFKQHVFKR